MKRLLILTLAFTGYTALAQTPFEGHITYDVKVFKRIGGGNGKMTIYFSKPGIRLEFAEEKNHGKPDEFVIINFDSGLLFKLNPKSKSYTATPLLKKQNPSVPANRLIEGYTTTPVLFTAEGFLKEAASLFGTAMFYMADSLFYPVPETYVSIPELLMISKGRIVLGGDFYPSERRSNQWGQNNALEEQKDTGAIFTVLATAVKAQENSQLLFIAPATYKKSDDNYLFVPDAMDSMAMMADTSAAVPTVPPKKIPKTPAKTKSATKQSALRRKDN